MASTPQPQHRICIDDECLVVDNTTFDAPTSLKSLRHIFGAETRHEIQPTGDDHVWIWDHLGIVAFGKVPDTIHGIRVYFFPEQDGPRSPQNAFAGSLVVGGVSRNPQEPLNSFLHRLQSDKSGGRLRRDGSSKYKDAELTKWTARDDNNLAAGGIDLWDTDSRIASWVAYYFPTRSRAPEEAVSGPHGRSGQRSSPIRTDRSPGSVARDETVRVFVRWFWRGGWRLFLLIIIVLILWAFFSR